MKASKQSRHSMKFIMVILVIISISFGAIYYANNYSQALSYHPGDAVSCSLVYDYYGIEVGNDMSCEKMMDVDTWSEVKAILIKDSNEQDYAYIGKEVLMDSAAARSRQKEALLKTECIKFHEFNLTIRYYGYEGFYISDDEARHVITNIYAGFDYEIGDVHMYLHDIGPNMTVPGKPEDIKEGSYEEALQEQITSFIDKALLIH